MIEWLQNLEMEEYTEVFHSAGYETESDIENLKELDDEELKKMGIVKMGNFQYFNYNYRVIPANIYMLFLLSLCNCW